MRSKGKEAQTIMAKKRKRRKRTRMPPYHFDGLHCRDSQGAFVPVAQCRRKKKPGGGLGHVTIGEARKITAALNKYSREKQHYINEGYDEEATWFHGKREAVIDLASDFGLRCECRKVRRKEQERCSCGVSKKAVDEYFRKQWGWK